MGLVVEGDLVRVDHGVVDWLETRSDGYSNPQVKIKDSLKISSIFSRRQPKKTKSQRLRGDNCPLIYALKNQEGLHTDFHSVNLLNESFKEILKKIEYEDIDVVVCMPSSSNLCAIFGKRVANHFSAKLVDKIFKKISVIEAIQNIDSAYDLGNISRETRKSLIARVRKNPQCGFSLKHIPTKHRKHITPITFLDISELQNECRVLLVDDLLATGTTLLAAKSSLEKLPKKINVIGAMCLFGKMS